jgi:hypothetical protein
MDVSLCLNRSNLAKALYLTKWQGISSEKTEEKWAESPISINSNIYAWLIM